MWGDFMVNFKYDIAPIMKEQGRTQQELADFLGVSKSMVSQWSSGNLLSYNKYLDGISEFLNCSFELSGNKKSPADMTIDEAKKELYEIAKRLSPENYGRLLDHAKLLQAVEQKKAKE